MKLTNFWNNVTLEREGLQVRSRGLSKRGQSELVVRVDSAELITHAEQFLRHVIKYLDQVKTRITDGQTMNYGYWLVKFLSASNDLLEVWEYDPSGTDFIRGGSLTFTYWRDQHAICDKYGAAFSPPNPEQLTVVSAGVLEGELPIQAVRYPWAEHMSGWIIMSEQYDGNIESLMHHHTYHVTANRPDLAQYIALPFGYRVDLAHGEHVWFDQKVASEILEH